MTTRRANFLFGLTCVLAIWIFSHCNEALWWHFPARKRNDQVTLYVDKWCFYEPITPATYVYDFAFLAIPLELLTLITRPWKKT
jgi:hypothetical protein